MDIAWLGTLVPLAVFTGFFIGLHVLTLRRLEPVYPRAFKLSRGAAAIILTALGVAALIGGIDHWREAYIYHHADGDWMRFGLLAVYGHLLADFIWMVVGARRFGVQPRKDLIIHHALGVLGFGAALWLHVGYAIALVTMVTEVLPLTTGINAWGKRIAMEGVVRAADRARLHVLAWLRLPMWVLLRARLHVLAWLRLPMWVLLCGLSTWTLVRGDAGDLQAAYTIAAVGLVGLIVLDLYWMKKCRENVDFY